MVNDDLTHWAEMIEADQQLIAVLHTRYPVMADVKCMITEQIERSEENIAYYQELIERNL